MRMGIMITSKCDYKCGHCMFSCTSRGRHMDDETIKVVSNFINNNRPWQINIYGGEPFLDIDHFKKCFDKFYDNDINFHISSNGSFLSNRKRLDYVWDVCRKLQNNNSDLGGRIRISNTIFHDEFRSEKQKAALNKLQWVLREPYTWSDEYESDEYSSNPIMTNGYDDGTVIYIDTKSGYEAINPSGRAIDKYSNDRECSCVLAASGNSYNNIHEMYEDCCTVNINYKGNVGMCCFCDCGTVGHISEFETFEDIEKAILKFRRQFRDKYKFGSRTKMEDTCYLCKKFKMKKGE